MGIGTGIRFRIEQWRALPPELRRGKLVQKVRDLARSVCRHGRPRAQWADRGAFTGLLPLFRMPSEEHLAPFRAGLLFWWEQLEGQALPVFPPYWVRVAELSSVERVGAQWDEEGLRLLPEGHRWFEWKRDIFSGSRWEEGAGRDWEAPPGVDPKGVWELGRLQWLPTLAMLGACGEEPLASGARAWLRALVVDFLLQNPPGVGIHWASPLEVAVRTFSLLVGISLMRQQGLLDPQLERFVLGSLYRHGRFLMENLEWGGGLRGNHYVGNIVGLLALGALLQGSPYADVWLAFGVQELVQEVLMQFLPDGGHWEGATYYHRFVLEMVVSGTALVLGLPTERWQRLRQLDLRWWRGERPLVGEFTQAWQETGTPFPAQYWERLQAALRFAVAVMKPNGRAPQIGDHDSGRWLKLVPRLSPATAQELRAAEVPHFCFIPDQAEDPREWRSTLGLAASLVQECPMAWRQQPEAALLPHFPIVRLQEVAAVEVFPDFGLVLYRWGDFFLAVRCGGLEQAHPSGGHMHCDQLSLELAFGQSDVIVDPGTYCYRADSERRNQLRSTAAHNTVAVPGIEQFRFFGHSAEALFWLFRHGVHVQLLHADAAGFAAEFVHRRYWHRRQLRLLPAGLEGEEQYRGPEQAAVYFHLDPTVVLERHSPQELHWRTPSGVLSFWSSVPAEQEVGVFSPGYGVLQRSWVVRLPLSAGEDRLRWRIQRQG